ncbi:MAG: GTP-binding protein, partial [Rhodospirillaceae bacterium]|nr:GTP-binding protein [Rhodospirillaceae bacterium]
CTVADEFLPVMQSLLERDNPPQHIVIETSGLALPKPLIKAFNWPEIKTRVSVDGVISVIDGPAYGDGLFSHDHEAADASHETPLSEVFEDQLHAADMVLLNKTDQLDSDSISELETSLKKIIRPGVQVIATTHGNAPVDVLLGIEAGAEDDLDVRRSHHHGDHDHDHDDFESFVVEFGQIVDPEKLEQILINVANDFSVLRVKGFVDVAGKTSRHLVQGVGTRFTRYFDRPWAENERRQSRLVIIGESGLKKKEITTAIKTAAIDKAA